MKQLVASIMLLMVGFICYGQSVGIGTSSPDNTALLELKSNSKGFLPPRITFQERNAIQNPAFGLTIYCTDCKTTYGEMQYYNGNEWISMSSGSASIPSIQPSVTISGINSLTRNSASIICTINNDGGSPVIMRGVCWSVSPHPDINMATKTQDSSGIGAYTSILSGLSPNTTYYVRAYAINSIGVLYSVDSVFSTNSFSLPIFTSSVVSILQSNSAIIETDIQDDGGSSVIFRGVCWSTSPNPNTSLPTKTLDSSGIGRYASTITGLSTNTLYYARAYAINSTGTVYGPELVFSAAISFKKKILVEYITGTWSQYDTRVINKLETYKTSRPDCILTAIHGAVNDPFQFQFYPTFRTEFNLAGYPSAIINRRQGRWNENTSVLDAELLGDAPLGIDIRSTQNNGIISGVVSVKFGNYIQSPMKIVVALVENGLVYPQTNVYSQLGTTPTIADYMHNQVLRKTFTNFLGDDIPSFYQSSLGTYDLPFSFSLTGVIYGGGNYSAIPSKSAIVAFVLDASTNSTIGIYNVQYAPVGTTVGYEFLP
jgi:hypothetical protein